MSCVVLGSATEGCVEPVPNGVVWVQQRDILKLKLKRGDEDSIFLYEN